FFVARYTRGGKPDTTFGGGDGIVRLDFLGGYDDAWGINRMANGKYVVAGYAENPQGTFDHVAVARFLPTGDLDDTFSADGKVTTAFQNYSSVYGWRSLVQPNGKVVVAGEAYQNGGS